MVKALDERLIAESRKVALNLDDLGTPVDAAFWTFDEEGERWVFCIASSRVSEEGPLVVIRAVQSLLDARRKEFGQIISLNDVRVMDLDDPLVDEIRDRARTIKPGDTTVKLSLIQGPLQGVIWTYREPPHLSTSIVLNDHHGDPCDVRLYLTPIFSGYVESWVYGTALELALADSVFSFTSLEGLLAEPPPEMDFVVDGHEIVLTREEDRIAVTWKFNGEETGAYGSVDSFRQAVDFLRGTAAGRKRKEGTILRRRRRESQQDED